MRNINSILYKSFAVVSLSALLFSCSEDTMDKINNDSSHTKDAPAKFILADVITKTAFSNVGGDVNTYTSSYVEHEAGVHNQLYRAERRQNEPSAASTFNSAWIAMYTTLKNARIIIKKCSEGGSEYQTPEVRGIAYIMAAYNSALITDLFGDTPWSEAALQDEAGMPLFMNPKVDKQEDIYKEIITYLDNAILDLEGVRSIPVGEYDLIYNGDPQKWLKFAYGLKARYTMRLINKASNKAAEFEKVLEYTSKSFTSADEQAAYAIYDASNLNPLFDFQWSRDALAASESMAEKLIERKDPRLSRVFVDAGWTQLQGPEEKTWLPAPNGLADQMQYYYNTSAFMFSQTAPTLLLSYHEILFLRAEALCRLNRVEEAEVVLKEAIMAGIQNTEINVKAAINSPTILNYGGVTETTDAISEEAVAKYFEEEVKSLFAANPLKETMIQKYIAFFGASGESTECYSDIRRMKGMGEDFITLKNPNKFPLRCPYGQSDVTANPNITSIFGNGDYVYTEPVWWAGGSR